VVTGAGALPAHIVVHAIGPIWHGGGRGENTALERCYERAILASIERGHRTIAFPAISTGAYGFPLDRSALIAGNAIARLIKENPGKLDTVWMVLHGDDAFAEYRRQFALVIEEMTGTPF
jgi:O-acetyl-ADP-ribose deacetylase (regulator of RNase III)